MKKSFIIPVLLLVSLLYTSCKKDYVVISDDMISAVPTSFKQKVLIEKNTGEWCGWCPSGAKVLNDIIAANPKNVIGVSIHAGDPMELTDYSDWQRAKTLVSGFPSGSIQRDRAIGRGSWNEFTNLALAKTAPCGIAIESSGGNDLLKIAVHIGYNQSITDQSRVTVLITEDNVPQSSPGAQSNYVPNEINVDNNWQHQHVLRACLTDVAGDLVQLNNLSARKTIVNFEIEDLNQYDFENIDNCKIVAFVHTNEAPAFNTKNVFNVQSVKLNSTKNWN